MKQSSAWSLFESIINVAAGFSISLVAQWFFLPFLGVAISFEQNLIFAVIMTGISIARTFILRRIFEALHIRRPLSPFMQAVIAERYRQMEVEGFDHAHDDRLAPGELARAGGTYAVMALRPSLPSGFKPGIWPWSVDWWKPRDFRRDIVRAAALILAEGERFDRMRKRGKT